jgi:hypothetical protein
MGLGGGRGMGGARGGGRGMGGCGGSRWSSGMAGTDMVSSKASQTKASTPQEEAERLKQTAQDLRRQLEAIEGRIGDLAGSKNAIS